MNTSTNKRYRNELKFELTELYAKILRHKLSLIMEPEREEYMVNGKYNVRSLYFDDIYDTAYYEKMNGIPNRKKYRIRFYNLDSSYIKLELKGKDGNLGYKQSDQINLEEYFHIINKNYDKIDINGREVLEKFIEEAKFNNLIPSIIVDYFRIAYTFPIEDVRITFDIDISSGKFDYDLFSKDINLFNILEDNKIILEVKYNTFLPKIITNILKTIPMSKIAMSKFAMCKEKKRV